MSSVNLKELNTEQRNQNTMMIDSLETSEMLRKINEEDKTIALAVEKELEAITKLVDESYKKMRVGGRVFYVGAGTSGRLGVLDASECPPTFGVSFDLFQGIIAGGYPALLKAKEGAEDDVSLGKQDLVERGFCEKDICIGIAASGRTPYVVGALKFANEVGGLTGSICCVNEGAISKEAKYPIEVITGAEAVTGSTRMKAGTAQKMVLNMISTSLMIKMGKVYQNLMVDVQPTNEKLNERAIRIIMNASNCNYEEASNAFLESEKDVKIAILMVLIHQDKESCHRYLNENDGNISLAIRSAL